jgi:hypothetical protein
VGSYEIVERFQVLLDLAQHQKRAVPEQPPLRARVDLAAPVAVAEHELPERDAIALGLVGGPASVGNGLADPVGETEVLLRKRVLGGRTQQGLDVEHLNALERDELGERLEQRMLGAPRVVVFSHLIEARLDRDHDVDARERERLSLVDRQDPA